MAFAGKEAGRRVKPDPACAGQIDLGPGMQVGKVLGRAGGAVERLNIGSQLNQVPGDEARGKAKVAENLNQQPAGIAAGSAARSERELGRLHTGLHANQIADVALQALVEHHQKVVGGHGGAGNRSQPFTQQRAGCRMRHKGREFVSQRGFVSERKLLSVVFEKKIEGIDHRQVGDQIDLHFEMLGEFGVDETREVVALRVLLPVQKMAGGLNPKRVTQDRRAAVRSGTQANHLGSQGH